MKSKIVAAALFAFTAGGIALYPAMKNMAANVEPPAPAIGYWPEQTTARLEPPKVEVVFALDTTGSMGGLIQAAKEKIWSIATTLAQAQPAPEIRMGLVAYRDRGDTYVTRLTDLSSDLDSVYAKLMEFRAEGGGDGPESVNQALADAVDRISWSSDPNAYKVIFLVGDAPPHMDYQDDVKYPQTLATAKARGIVVNTVLAGHSGVTREVWQQIAQTGGGHYAQVAQSGDAVAIATPYDERLAKLSAELDETRLYYGSAEEKAKREMKQTAAKKLHEEASVASRARRATFNATKSGAANLLGEGELVEDVTSGRVDLDSLAPEALPAPIQAMSPQEQKAVIAKSAERRAALNKTIKELAEQRALFLHDKVEAAGGAGASLDQKLYDAIRDQGSKKGMRYEAESPAY
ncbi:MAG: VWA domain-containing protein [Candidatus Thiodiazotropha sp. (ex Epidulcina cf. delphinae)]|nr:VWA domain-containing protein [Candidatus Thiodiazotropha sp. (ex Epidulcina cf. delphinae)]